MIRCINYPQCKICMTSRLVKRLGATALDYAVLFICLYLLSLVLIQMPKLLHFFSDFVDRPVISANL